MVATPRNNSICYCHQGPGLNRRENYGLEKQSNFLEVHTPEQYLVHLFRQLTFSLRTSDSCKHSPVPHICSLPFFAPFSANDLNFSQIVKTRNASTFQHQNFIPSRKGNVSIHPSKGCTSTCFLYPNPCLSGQPLFCRILPISV